MSEKRAVAESVPQGCNTVSKDHQGGTNLDNCRADKLLVHFSYMRLLLAIALSAA